DVMAELQIRQVRTARLLEEKRQEEVALAEAEVAKQHASNEASIVDTLLENILQQEAVTQELEKQFALVREKLKRNLQSLVPAPVQESERGIVLRLDNIIVPQHAARFIPGTARNPSSASSQVTAI